MTPPIECLLLLPGPNDQDVEMKKNLAALSAHFLVACLSLTSVAQSVVIQSEPLDGTRAIRVPVADSTIPNSYSDQQKQIIALLFQRYPSKFIGVQNVEQLMSVLREIGLPVELDQSAVDDCAGLEDQIDIQLQNVPLLAMLEQSLGELNATLALTGNRLRVVSRDVVNDPEYFVHVTYDVTSLQFGDGFTAGEFVKNLIAPDHWDDTNGDGALIYRKLGNRKLVFVAQPLLIQLQLQELFDSMQRVQGSSGTIAGRSPSSAYRESRVIGLPEQFEPDFRRLRGFHGGGGFGGGGFGGGGIGGYGLGGGVF